MICRQWQTSHRLLIHAAQVSHLRQRQMCMLRLIMPSAAAYLHTDEEVVVALDLVPAHDRLILPLCMYGVRSQGRSLPSQTLLTVLGSQASKIHKG